MNTIRYFFLFILCVSYHTQAQNIQKDTLTRTANIVLEKKGNTVSFKTETPPLNQIAGAPKAFYTYLWEFGDGDYSTQEQPTHSYQKGQYKARVSVTNNYDDGKPPRTRPRDFAVNEDTNPLNNEDHKLFIAYDGARLLTNRDPVPNQTIDLIFSYGNDKDYVTNGKLYLFYNEKAFKNKNFALEDSRTYFGEEAIDKEEILAINNYSSTNDIASSEEQMGLMAADTTKNQNLLLSLEEAKSTYEDYKIWKFKNMQPGEKRNIFTTFKTTPEMIKDTSAVVTIRGIYIPDENSETHKIVEKEMEIVTSHDPNKMAVYNRRINYRLVRFEKMKYKIKFQNNGEGPARTIKLVTETPKMLDNETLEVLDMYPKCPICPKQEVQYSCLDTIIAKDSIIFTFKNIYLPGSTQKNVMDKDSTKGFVKYRLKFAKDFHKVTQRSKTAIIFDKNPPIITNTSVARFKTGISIGVRSGYSYFLNSEMKGYENKNITLDTKGYFVGATISPYKAYKKYLQAEFSIESTNGLNSIENYLGLSDVALSNGTTVLDTQTYLRETYELSKTSITLVPISYRYNFNSIFAAGLGVQSKFTLAQTLEVTTKRVHYQNNQGEQGSEITNLAVPETAYSSSTKSNFDFYNFGAFVDLTAGASRIGPSGGIRYLIGSKKEMALQFYAIWKF